MLKTQNARQNANRRAKTFLADHNDALIEIPLYPGYKENLDTNMTKIETAIINQGVDVKVITADKIGLKENMCKLIYKYSLRASVQANTLGKTELELALDKPYTYISQADDNTSVLRAKELFILMKENVGILDLIQSENIEEMQAAIEAFAAIQNLPTQQIKHKKAEGTDLITQLLDEIDVDKKNIGKLIHSYAPDLAHDWNLCIKVGTPIGTRHTSIAIQFVDALAQMPLKEVSCTISNGTEALTKLSSAKGWVRFDSLPNALWDITSEYDAYQTDVQKNIATQEQKMVSLQLGLKKL